MDHHVIRIGRAGGMAAAAISGGIPPPAHQADVIAVGIGHDRVPGAPEGIKRRLPATVSSATNAG
jgi:hypothetical protein